MGWKIWSFSGTVEFDKLGSGDAFGWTWFQMMENQDSKTDDWVLKWTGIAKVGCIDCQKKVWAQRVKDELFGVSQMLHSAWNT